jgi:uncharacterized protein (DUF433 family)
VPGEAGTRPVLGRTRHEVQEIFALLAGGRSEAELCGSYGLKPEEIRACFEYASELVADRMMQRADPGDAKVHVSERQLADAFRRHVAVLSSREENLTPSQLLLLVYGVECGLKRLLLQRRGLKNTKKLERDDFTHDLNELLKILNINKRFAVIRLETPDEKDVPSQRIHEALRYGRPIARSSWNDILKVIRAVIAELEEL